MGAPFIVRGGGGGGGGGGEGEYIPFRNFVWPLQFTYFLIMFPINPNKINNK